MKKNFPKTLQFLSPFLLSLFFINSFLGNSAAQANDNISNLIECKNSTNFEKRLTSSIKKFENRVKLYEENTPQAEFLKKEISLTNARFESYKKSNLLCGKDGLPHLITSGDLNHFNEFSLPALIFLYITGWIGWAGRKYLQYSLTTENSFENEIIINIPIAFPIIISGFLWPIEAWKEFIALPENSPEVVETISGVKAEEIRNAARLYATAKNSTIYYGLGVTEHSQGSTMVMGMANLAMATGNIGREGVGVNPLRGQNNVQGSCDMGSFPHEYSGYRHVSDDSVKELFESMWNAPMQSEPGLRIPNMLDAAISGEFKGIYIQGEDIAQSDPNVKHVKEALSSMEMVIVQDLFINETAQFAHVFLPGTSFLEKDGTFTNAERRINRVRPVMASKTGKSEWEATCDLSKAMGYEMKYENASQIMDEIAKLTPTFAGVSFKLLDAVKFPVLLNVH